MDSKIIECDRCGIEFSRLHNIRRHLQRKTVCMPLKADIPISELIEKYSYKKGLYKCENCNKVYKTSVGKCKHKKNCTKKIIEKMVDNELIYEKIEKQIKNLLSNNSVQNITNNVNNVNNNNIIIINNFGEENIDYLLQDNEFINKCIESPINSIQRYLDAVHFNQAHPENKNIKLTNLQSPFMDCFKNGNWNKVEQKLLIPNIVHKSVSIINKMIDENSDEWNEYKAHLDHKHDVVIKNKTLMKTKRHIYNKSSS
jgi:hypothetical protein